MAFIKRVFTLAFVALAVAPFASANYPSKTASQSCSKSEFYYGKKECCLPSGGPPKTPTPPSGKSCPVGNSKDSYWYWHTGKGCCVPSHPQPPSNPTPPQCNYGHGWQESLQCCTPSTPSKPTYTPKPSVKPGYPGYGHSGWKRSHLSRSAPACPNGLDACLIPGLSSGDYECLDTSVELESCGGCAFLGQGQDCSAIKGVWNVGCESGSCRVYSCTAGYKISADGSSCIAI